jgi:hypothetical protein
MFTERELLKQLGAEIEGISRYLWVSVFSNDTPFMLLGDGSAQPTVCVAGYACA